ncbi:MAG: hypothetical protein DYH02_05885 [Candidatus Omnitrophica bacterium COP1]|nr:hypothetical protein [Candidatus Omnitrophica bacterium COP1]
MLVGEVQHAGPCQGLEFGFFKQAGGAPTVDQEESLTGYRAADKKTEPDKKEPSEQIGISPSSRAARDSSTVFRYSQPIQTREM